MLNLLMTQVFDTNSLETTKGDMIQDSIWLIKSFNTIEKIHPIKESPWYFTKKD